MQENKIAWVVELKEELEHSCGLIDLDDEVTPEWFTPEATELTAFGSNAKTLIDEVVSMFFKTYPLDRKSEILFHPFPHIKVHKLDWLDMLENVITSHIEEFLENIKKINAGQIDKAIGLIKTLIQTPVFQMEINSSIPPIGVFHHSPGYTPQQPAWSSRDLFDLIKGCDGEYVYIIFTRFIKLTIKG